MKPEARVDRCRVRDLVASCFNTCRLPLQEEEEDEAANTSRDDVRGHEAAAVKATSQSKRRLEAEAEPPFAEEDYIVFCFGEDGKIHMMDNDGRSTSEIKPSTAITASTKNEVDEQPNASKMESSFESCDSSSVSDTSTSSSFAFPLVGMEWIGSPPHMPKEEKRDAYRRCSTF